MFFWVHRASDMPQEARTLLFIHGPSAAEVQLQNLLSLVLHSYSLAAQCPAAIATASYSLAEVRAALEPAWQLEKNRSFGLKQLALLQLSLAMYPLAAHEECTQHLSLSDFFLINIFDTFSFPQGVPGAMPRNSCRALISWAISFPTGKCGINMIQFGEFCFCFSHF